jgi:hypothetical protein
MIRAARERINQGKYLEARKGGRVFKILFMDGHREPLELREVKVVCTRQPRGVFSVEYCRLLSK